MKPSKMKILAMIVQILLVFDTLKAIVEAS